MHLWSIIMENEIWKPVVGYEGLYAVSNLGRVRSFDRVVNARSGGQATRKGRELSHIRTYKGYTQVTLYKDMKGKIFLIHSLVANHFIVNPKGRTMVNHLNEIKTDNRAENLEWTTYYENNNYGTRTKRASRTLRNSRLRVPILMFTNGEFSMYFKSIKEMSRQLNFNGANVAKVLNSKTKTAYGHSWKRF